MSKTKEKKQVKGTVSMPLVNPNAAGIDIGDTLLSVAIPEGRAIESVKNFSAFTCDLISISHWLQEHGIETVAMESTGIYWKNLYSVLVQDGFEVYLVNAKHTKNVTGRKTDESDAQWIQRLHSCGLLNSSFLPDDQTETLRTLVRFRKSLTQDSTRYILRMQKSLESMNIKISTVISDLVGKTGTAIVKAILEGERNPVNFLPFVDGRIKASREVILKSLEGNWRKEHLITLKQSFELYNFIQQQIIDCEKEIELTLQNYMASKNDGVIESVEEEKKSPKRKLRTIPYLIPDPI